MRNPGCEDAACTIRRGGRRCPSTPPSRCASRRLRLRHRRIAGGYRLGVPAGADPPRSPSQISSQLRRRRGASWAQSRCQHRLDEVDPSSRPLDSCCTQPSALNSGHPVRLEEATWDPRRDTETADRRRNRPCTSLRSESPAQTCEGSCYRRSAHHLHAIPGGHGRGS